MNGRTLDGIIDKDALKARLTEWKWRLIGILGDRLIHLIFHWSDRRILGWEKVRPFFESKRVIGAFWHSRILMVSYLFKGWDAAIMVSASEDGEYIARVLEHQGHETVRGSTTRGGLRAMAKLIRLLKERDRPAVVIPDGPQGPRFKVQPGVIALAKKTGYPIVPMTYSARKMKIFNSWDRFILPRPLTRCVYIYGEPVRVPETADKPTEERLRKQLEDEMNRITREADGLFGRRID